MVARVTEMIVQPGRAEEFCRLVKTLVIPLLRKQPGFVDCLVMQLEKEHRVALAISLWKTEAEAKRYERHLFPRVLLVLQPLLETDPVIKLFDLCLSAAGQTPVVAPERKRPTAA
ncbi:MAG TPA: antibiotic biosynthesis monooxygenase [Terriglobales bacterium]|nr:antibiotic biosynthesis monooxygenase [Terriglobales bacterium]